MTEKGLNNIAAAIAFAAILVVLLPILACGGCLAFYSHTQSELDRMEAEANLPAQKKPGG